MRTSSTRPHLIGELCLGGDWACAHGDFAALRDVVERLSELEHEPLHCELRTIAEACAANPDVAAKLWASIRDRLYEGS